MNSEGQIRERGQSECKPGLAMEEDLVARRKSTEEANRKDNTIIFGLFEGIKAGENAVSKRTGNPVVVECVEYDKAFVRSVGNLSGELTGSWCDKNAFRRPRLKILLRMGRCLMQMAPL